MLSRRERYEETQRRLHAKMRQDLMDKQNAMIASGQFDRQKDVVVCFNHAYDVKASTKRAIY